MSRMPCSVTDDPSFDYSDYYEGKGYYATNEQDDDEDNHDNEEQDTWF